MVVANPRPWLVAALVALLCAGCGPARDADESMQRPAVDGTAPMVNDECALPSFHRRMDAGRARRLLDSAVTKAGDTDRAFQTILDVWIDGRHSHGVLDGIRTAAGAGTGTLDWDDRRSTLPRGIIRIESDVVTIATREDTPPFELGSAAGIELDVGRELLAHRPLVDVVAARGTDGEFTIALVAPARRLRLHAQRERTGPVSELLGSTRSLAIRAHVRNQLLVADSFSLVVADRRDTGSGSIRVDGITCGQASSSVPSASPSS